MIVVRLLALFLSLLIPVTTQGWGFFAHQRINQLAVFLLPPEMLAFYKPQQAWLTTHATDPDKRRYVLPEEGARHYIDIDHYGFAMLPWRWQDALDCYGADTLQAYGVLPWHLSAMMARLTQAFTDKDPARVLKLSADLGHYVADAHVPLHACSNHDGQFTGQQGIHALWESRIPELLADATFNYWAGKAEYIPDIAAQSWQIIAESALAADTVLRTEKALSEEYTAQRFAYERRQGKLMRNYARAYTKAYQQRLGDMVERRMRKAMHMVASYWYTAWVNAGQPPLQVLCHGRLPVDTPLPVTGKMLGRPE